MKYQALWENYLRKLLFKLGIKNKLLHGLEDKDSLFEIHKIISKFKYQ